MRQAGCSKRQSFLEVCDTEQLHVGGHRFRYADQTMSVRIRFHHGQYFGASDPLADGPDIVTQGVTVDLSPASIGFAHFFLGVVMCGSRKNIGSSGGKTNARFAFSASRARISAEG